ncbi:extracellular solute-binding protein [Paenibacillus spongiae]|uniref:Extracellular solute-binding protein n=1 Tax=Paenibacillus spongiae TaxID=2909671 RepID=A0ABY5SJJ9_9BACL|nr:extracellular solute-binding protein [Paenibacillus spongiae]UVI32845.1 extracellular solute-binding protein [Paenibacillus spongiae]
MRKRKQIISTVVFISILTLLLAACGSDKDKENQAAQNGEKQAANKEEPYELTYLTTGDQAAKPLQPNDRIIAEINKRLNIKLTVKIVPEGSIDKINAAFASGDLPDVVSTYFPKNAVSQWIDEGIIIPLNDYLDDMPTFKKDIEELGLQWTAVDGKYNGYPFVSGINKSNYAVQYRGDWLEKLGISPPETLDDFYHALKAVANKDTYGFTTNKPNAGDQFGAFNFVFFAYGLPYGDYALDGNDNVIPIFEHPAFKQGIEYLRKLWDEKLIDPEFMAIDRPTKEQKFFQGKAAFMDGPLFRHLNRIETGVQKVDPAAKLAWIAPPAGPDGKRGMPQKPKGGILTSVTTAAKNPQKAAEFIEFLLSREGKDLLELGIEGLHYTKDGDTIHYKEDERAKDGFAENGWAHPLAWGNVTWPIDDDYLPQTEPQRERAVQSVEEASQYFVPNLVERRTAEEIELGSTVNDIYNQYFLNLVNGKLDIDKGIAELSGKWRQQGGDKILKAVNEAYKNSKK